MKYAIICETYSMGSEGAFQLKKQFNSKRLAKIYLTLKYGRIEKFIHNWNNDKGDWYSLIDQSLPRRYFCIKQIN